MHDRAIFHFQRIRRLRDGQHVSKNPRMTRQDASMNSKCDVGCDQDNIPIFEPQVIIMRNLNAGLVHAGAFPGIVFAWRHSTIHNMPNKKDSHDHVTILFSPSAQVSELYARRLKGLGRPTAVSLIRCLPPIMVSSHVIHKGPLDVTVPQWIMLDLTESYRIPTGAVSWLLNPLESTDFHWKTVEFSDCQALGDCWIPWNSLVSTVSSWKSVISSHQENTESTRIQWFPLSLVGIQTLTSKWHVITHRPYYLHMRVPYQTLNRDPPVAIKQLISHIVIKPPCTEWYIYVTLYANSSKSNHAFR